MASSQSDWSSKNMMHRKQSTRLGVMKFSNVPAPQCVKAYVDILQKISTLQPTMQNFAVINKLLQKQVKKNIDMKQGDIVHIRGLSKVVEDVNDMEFLSILKHSGQPVDESMHAAKNTCMWNPLHFAVYNGNFHMVKHLCEELQVNIGQTAPKNYAQNEGDLVNDQEAFIED